MKDDGAVMAFRKAYGVVNICFNELHSEIYFELGRIVRGFRGEYIFSKPAQRIAGSCLS